ncbi:MAG: cytochrome c [Sphingobacteriales bacterium]|nr:cytochrome c [Sphingobacteriales bacterium]
MFIANCSTCHTPTEELTGPALQGASSHWKNQKLLFGFVRNSQDVIQRNDYAMTLYRKYNSTYMTPFPKLTDEQITAILNYCDTQNATKK